MLASVATRTLVVALWLGGAALAALLALRHFWRTGRPAVTPTVVAMAVAFSFYVFVWPQVQSSIVTPWLFLALMCLSLGLALAAFVLPVVLRLQPERR